MKHPNEVFDFEGNGFIDNPFFWSWFAHKEWYRKLSGGLWQKFDLGSNGRPYYTWLRLKIEMPSAVETEKYG